MSTLVVGVPSEIKDNEKRVALTPDGVVELVHTGHQVVVQAGAGVGSRFSDDEYAAVGAKVVPTADEVFDAADLIVKVKEPVPAEYHRFRPTSPRTAVSPSSCSSAASTPSRTRPCRPPTASSRS
jgi:alanine dehydrogenase